MVHKCCVSVCGMSVRIPGAKGLSYHTFPAKEPTREKWIQAILPHVDKPESFRVVQGYTRVCSRHFKKKDYSMDSRKRARLSTNAVPTVFPGKNSPVNAQSKTSVTKFVEPNRRCPVIADPKEEAGGLEFSQDELGNLKIETSGHLQSCQIESVTISNDHLVLTFSEEETGSSKFSSQESLQIPSESNDRDTGKMRKRRKNRSEVPRPTSSGPKKRSSSSTSDDLNVNVVGDALAEINLSTLISASSSADLKQELESILTQPARNESRFRDSTGHQFSHNEMDVPRLEVVNHFDSPNSKYPVPNNSTEIEQDLLQSIQAVSLNSGDPPPCQPPIFVTRDGTAHESTSSGHRVSSVYSPPFMSHTESDSLLTNQIQDLYADLVDGGASLSLEDSNLATFNNQDLLEALRSATEELELPTDIDQLARDLNVSLLDGALTTSILDINGDSIRISDLDHSSLHSSFDFGRDLMHIQEVTQPDGTAESMEPPPAITVGLEGTPAVDTIQAGQSTPDVVEEPNSSPVEDVKLFVSPKVEVKSETSSPERSCGKKTTKKERAVGSFSVERFGDSDKDIEYYTGFPTFAKFEIFYRSLDSYVENLKVTDMMHGVANLTQVPSQAEAVSPKKEPAEMANEDKNPAPVQEEQKRRLSQGRSMSRIDELFMTIIRLKRKIPEKVLGHMFCISQPTVSRIIRAWTMLLSRVLELLPAEKGPSSRKSGSSPSGNSSDGSTETTELGIPRSFRQLFYSELAQSIIASGAASNSRKTSSSTTCPSVSRSKRPKKEKLVVNVSEGIASSTQPLAVSISNEVGMPTACLVSTGIQTISSPSESESVAAPAMSISSAH